MLPSWRWTWSAWAAQMQPACSSEPTNGTQDIDLPPPLLHLHIGLRAYVRAKVACLRSEQNGVGWNAASDLQALALKHLRSARSAVVLVGGLPGTGKSTLAAGLAAETGWPLIRSDEIRRQQSEGPDRYAPESRAAVYEELLSSAARTA